MTRVAGCVLAAAMLTCMGCSKAPTSAVAPTVTSEPPKVSLPTPATESQALADEARLAGLAKTYHDVRCVLVGSRFSPESLYEANGFASASAFSQAFQKAASADPAWARKAIADSYATDCKGKP